MNATDLRALLARWADVMAQKRDWLIELDSVVGDSDLGLTMSDGFRAASDAANACVLTDVGKLCYQAGKAMASAVPSTMGTLMASGPEAAQAAADAAWKAFENTRGMLARHGRMAIRGEASRELLDPGAAVAALLMKGYAEFKADSE